MKKIYFIRHAESEAGAIGIMAGPELETPLSAKGKEQAHEAGKFLKDKGIQLMMVSPMQRTQQTAAIIAEEIGLDASKLIENDLVIERRFGTYSGRPYVDYRKAIADGTVDVSQLEPTEEVHERVQKALKWLEARPEETILVVSHGSTCRMFHLVGQQMHHKDINEIKHFANAEIGELTI
jgi:probable phosphoglycerate mutase